MDDRLYRDGMGIAFEAMSARTDVEVGAILDRVAKLVECEYALTGVQIEVSPERHQTYAPLMKPPEGEDPEATERRRNAAGRIQHIISGFREDYQLTYVKEGFINEDPTVVHCLTRTDLMLWSDGMYAPSGMRMRDAAHAAGLGYGLSVPNHHGPDSISMLSAGRDRPLEGELVARCAPVLAVIGAALHTAAENFLVPRMFDAFQPRLSAREDECLKWVTAGKTDSEIGDLLNLSEETVRQYVKRIKGKLDVVTRPQVSAYGLRFRYFV